MTLHLLLVTFSLRNLTRDYSSFFVALRGNSLNWWHFIEQTCIVTTYKDVDAFAKLLYPHAEATDSLLVAEFDPEGAQGWLPAEAWEWFEMASQRVKKDRLENPFLTLPPPPGR